MQDSTVFAVLDVFNGRAQAATGVGEGEHAFASAQQWVLTTVGLDIDADEALALAQVLADMMGGTATRYPERAREVLVDGLRQMFVMGALHERERARREADAA
jgi:hypothetical protein